MARLIFVITLCLSFTALVSAYDVINIDLNGGAADPCYSGYGPFNNDYGGAVVLDEWNGYYQGEGEMMLSPRCEDIGAPGTPGAYARAVFIVDPCAPDPNLTGPDDGKWHHAVATFDCNNANPNSPPLLIQFYLDGTLLGSRLMEPNILEGITGVLGPEFREFLIGSEATSENLYNCFKGTLDEFALYDHVLPPERIAAHYKEGIYATPWSPETCAQIYKFGWNKLTDPSGDCRVNFEDMVDIGNDWWRCNEPSDTGCERPWLY